MDVFRKRSVKFIWEARVTWIKEFKMDEIGKIKEEVEMQVSK